MSYTVGFRLCNVIGSPKQPKQPLSLPWNPPRQPDREEVAFSILTTVKLLDHHWLCVGLCFYHIFLGR